MSVPEISKDKWSWKDPWSHVGSISVVSSFSQGLMSCSAEDEDWANDVLVFLSR